MTRTVSQLLLASNNPAKLARLRWLVEDLPVTVRTPADFSPRLHVSLPEDGADFLENAAQKAAAWSLASGGLLTLCSDGGLRIRSGAIFGLGTDESIGEGNGELQAKDFAAKFAVLTLEGFVDLGLKPGAVIADDAAPAGVTLYRRD